MPDSDASPIGIIIPREKDNNNDEVWLYDEIEKDDDRMPCGCLWEHAWVEMWATSNNIWTDRQGDTSACVSSNLLVAPEAYLL